MSAFHVEGLEDKEYWIRKANRGDIVSIECLLKTNSNSRKVEVKKHIREFYIAENRVVRTIGCIRKTVLNRGKEIYLLESLVVDKKCQNNGVGTDLVRICVSNSKKVYLITLAENVGFYQKVGFELLIKDMNDFGTLVLKDLASDNLLQVISNRDYTLNKKLMKLENRTSSESISKDALTSKLSNSSVAKENPEKKYDKIKRNFHARKNHIKNIKLTSIKRDGIAPENFYQTTNLKTKIRIDGRWQDVKNQKMDSLIAWDGKNAKCIKLGFLIKGMQVIVGEEGVESTVHEMERNFSFGFMNSDVSAEYNTKSTIKYIAKAMHEIKEKGKKIAYVLGPAVIHTGADIHVAELIKNGYMDVLLSGNALAVHDMEKCLYGTSLGKCAKSGENVHNGYKNHLKAINEVNKKGSIRKAVESGLINNGIMYECIKNEINFTLAASIRDDGPLFGVIDSCKESQQAYIEALKDVGLVIIGASMYHGISVGNVLSAEVETVCVDINPDVVNKLKNRGSWQAIGIVDNVENFFGKLFDELNI